MDSSQETCGTSTPVKRRRRGEWTSPKTPEVGKGGDGGKYEAWSNQRLCTELGALAATTARHPKFASSAFYASLLTPSDDTSLEWLTLESTPRRGMRPKLLAMDVEMCERLSDGAQLPVSAALVAIVPGIGERVIFQGLIDPGLSAQDEVAWKTEIHGIGPDTLSRAKAAGRLFSVGDVQALLAHEWDDLTFLVGHGLSGDLKVLKTRGPALRRRTIDTVLLHWTPGQGAPGLASLTGEQTMHDALSDARAAAKVVLDDIQQLLSTLQAPANRATKPPVCSPAPLKDKNNSRNSDSKVPTTTMKDQFLHRHVFFVPERLVGRVIGKKGASLEAIKRANPDCCVDLAPKGAEASSKRRLCLRSNSQKALKHCLDTILAHVPDLHAERGATPLG